MRGDLHLTNSNIAFIRDDQCKDQICGSVQDEWTQAQKVQNNEFVESGSKNQTLMNWTTANMELDDNHAQIRSTDMNELLVRGVKCSCPRRQVFI